MVSACSVEAPPESRLAGELEPDERLLWSGRPKQGLVLRGVDALPFSLLWGGFVIFWETMVVRESWRSQAAHHDVPIFFVLWGAPFVLIQCRMATGRARDERGSCAARFCLLTAVVLLLLTTGTGQASSASPCARNASQAARYCATICRVARRFDQAACVRRDRACVMSCQTYLSGCRETADIESDTLLCIDLFEAARVACLGQFPDASSPSFLACVEAARKDAVTCRSDFLHNVRQNGRFCGDQFDTCLNACPTTANVDVQQCRVQVVDAHTACLARCGDDLRAALELCGGREPDCVSTCDVGLASCTDSVEHNESAPIIACKVAYQTAIQACRALGSRLSCIAAAKNALTGCVGPVEDSAAGAFVGCDLAYDRCVDACPVF